MYRPPMGRSKAPRSPPQEETLEERAAFGKYCGWKRVLKEKLVFGDVKTMRALWHGALQILDGERKDLQQFVPRDLESKMLFGREHIEALINLDIDEDASKTFLTVAKPFLMVLTHKVLLDCLAVDTAVGYLYGFFCGSDGSQPVRFLKQVLTCLEICHPQAKQSESIQSNVKAFVAAAICLRELLRREERSRSYYGLVNLANSLEEVVQALELELLSAEYQTVTDTLLEIRGMVRRAQRASTGRVKLRADTTLQTADVDFGRDNFPCDIYDNDKRDITQITILPIEDEIRCAREEFLPSTDVNQPHFLDDPVSRHLDTYFRLYRHDIVGELKMNIGSLMNVIENNPSLLDSPRLNLSNMRAFSFPEATIKDITFHDKRGLEALLSFPQPPFAQRLASAGDRSKAWTDSKRLEQGVLLCFLYHDGHSCSILMFTVSEKKTGQKPDLINLSSDPRIATIHAQLATGLRSDFEKLVQISSKKVRGFLVEFPGVIPATFVPVLENTQNMAKNCRMPFQKWILHGKSEEEFTILPPLYARKSGFSFSLKPISNLQDGTVSSLIVSSTASTEDSAFIDKIEAQTSLDRGQCIALVGALTSEYVLIQGPPGTGKSYLGVNLMRVLLEEAKKACLGPIIVVCYTNHVLDQFLEHLTKIGIDNVIRVGGRSSSTELAGKNLRELSRKEVKTKPENTQIFQSKQKLEKTIEPLQNNLKTLKNVRIRPLFQDIEPHLADRYPLILSQFSLQEADGFQMAGRHPFEIWLRPQGLKRDHLYLEEGEIEMGIEEVIEIAKRSVESVQVRDRRRLLAHWTQELQESIINSIYEYVTKCEGFTQETRNVFDEVDRRTLQTAAVIGVTTTGLAKNIAILKHIPSKVIICEEAGEIMEPHMISALLPSVEHVISIGDHQQLRPSIQNFALSLESYHGPLFQLDKSQFERLAVGDNGKFRMPISQLNIQRRMRPEISKLIRKTVYPKLLDHKSTQNLPNVVGLKDNVFWLDHMVFEDKSNEEILQRERMAGWDKYNRELVDKSHKNSCEVVMVHAFVRHLVREGVYTSQDVAVLTPYIGQLRSLRTRFQQEFEVVLNERDEEDLENEDEARNEISAAKKVKPRTHTKSMNRMVRLATIDNFQGEEA